MSGEGRELSYSRLQEEQAKSLELSRERIEKWEVFKGDYEALQTRLYTLPDKLTHDIMVPFGRFGFVPGQLYHTNEVLVLLGDNWFAKRTVKQALDIAERRKQYVVKKLEEEQKQLKDWEARIFFTSDVKTAKKEYEDVVEIKEDYNPTRDTRGKARRARQPKHSGVPTPRPDFPKPSASADQSSSPANIQSKASKCDEELWRKLDELEREEEREDTEERGSEAEVFMEREMMERSEEEGTVMEGKLPRGGSVRSDGAAPIKIIVKHSQDDPTNTTEFVEDDSEEQALFRTPADISKVHQRMGDEDAGSDTESQHRDTVEEKRVKGVRWDPELGSEEEEDEDKEEDGRISEKRGGHESGQSKERTISDQAPLAFSGKIVERKISPISSAVQDTSKRVSKFKASRRTGT